MNMNKALFATMARTYFKDFIRDRKLALLEHDEKERRILVSINFGDDQMGKIIGKAWLTGEFYMEFKKAFGVSIDGSQEKE